MVLGALSGASYRAGRERAQGAWLVAEVTRVLDLLEFFELVHKCVRFGGFDYPGVSERP